MKSTFRPHGLVPVDVVKDKDNKPVAVKDGAGSQLLALVLDSSGKEVARGFFAPSAIADGFAMVAVERQTDDSYDITFNASTESGHGFLPGSSARIPKELVICQFGPSKFSECPFCLEALNRP